MNKWKLVQISSIFSWNSFSRVVFFIIFAHPATRWSSECMSVYVWNSTPSREDALFNTNPPSTPTVKAQLSVGPPLGGGIVFNGRLEKFKLNYLWNWCLRSVWGRVCVWKCFNFSSWKSVTKKNEKKKTYSHLWSDVDAETGKVWEFTGICAMCFICEKCTSGTERSITNYRGRISGTTNGNRLGLRAI